jgi:ferritin-like metal-binding protein YciE
MATTTARDTLIGWLRDAYAMEAQAVEMLERQVDRIDSYPDVLAKAREHLDLSRLQGERVEQCLGLLDADTSSIKTGIGKLMGNVQSLSGLVTTDEILKAFVFNAAFERFEIANYTVLITAAEELGEREVARLLSLNREEEVEMADWLDHRLSNLARTYLVRIAEEAVGDAKR